MKFKNIELEDVPILKQKLKEVKTDLVDYSLSTLFIYQTKYKYKYAIVDDFLFIQASLTSNNDIYFYPPLGGDINKGFEIILNYIKDKGLQARFFSVLKEQLEEISPKTLQNFTIFNNRDNYDYIYSVEELSELKGNKLASKRKFVNNFMKRYEGHYTIEIIKKEDKNSLLSYMDTWKMQQGNEDFAAVNSEKDVVSKLIDNETQLNSFGIILKIDNEVVGFTIGAYYNDMFIQHIEKSTHTIRGLYQMSTHFLSLYLDKNKAKYVNKEEDLGLFGLRKAKTSYQPTEMIENYILLDNSINSISFKKEHNEEELFNLFNKSFDDEAFNNYFFKSGEYKNFDITAMIFDKTLVSVKYEKPLTSNNNDSLSYLFGLSTDENYKKHGFMNKLIFHNEKKNSFLLLETEELKNFYSNLGFSCHSSYVFTKFVSKSKEFNYSSEYEIKEIDETYINEIDALYENILQDTNYIKREQIHWKTLFKQYYLCDNCVLGLFKDEKLVAYAFHEVKENTITEIIGTDTDINALLQMLFYKNSINNIKVNFFSKENSNQCFMAHQWELGDMYINMLFN